MTDDVRKLLDTAFGEEPPLGIDRDEVLRRGRRGLRRRRILEAGGVVAAVVVAVVGAATLTSVLSTGQVAPAAPTVTRAAPPGPELPMPSSSAPPADEPSADPAELTRLLYASGVVDERDVRPVPAGDAEPSFRVAGTGYEYQADIVTAEGSGHLEVTVDRAPFAVIDCATIPTTFGQCEVRHLSSGAVVLSNWHGRNGERRTFALAVRKDGTRVAAIATNITTRDLYEGRTPVADTPPVIPVDALCVLTLEAGFRVS